MSDVLTSPLMHVYEQNNVRLTNFAGWMMPLRFTSDLEEHNAVRTCAGVFDLSHMGQIEVIGPQAGAALDYCFVGQCSTLPIGKAKYTLMVTNEGGIVDDLLVYRLAEQEFLVVPNAANRIVVLDELTARTQAFNLSVTDHTTSRAMIAIQGPLSQQILKDHLDPSPATLGYYRCSTSTFFNENRRIPVLVARTGYTGEDGFEISIPANEASWVWEALTLKEQTWQCGLAARDTLRLEAGMPLYGNELNTSRTPYDVGLGKMVDLHHEFVGKTALLSAAQAPKTHLVGLVGEGRRAARAGSVVTLNGEPIGEITSGILSPSLGYPIALGLVNKEISDHTQVEVDVRGRKLPMRSVTPPFYRRDQHKS